MLRRLRLEMRLTIIWVVVVAAGCGNSVRKNPDAGGASTADAALEVDGLSAEEKWVEGKLSAMSDAAKVGQLLMMRTAGECSVADDWLEDVQPGGVMFYGEDVSTVEELRSGNRALLACAQSAGMSVPPLLATNHEGGRVDNFEPGSMTDIPSAAEQCSVGPSWIEGLASIQGQELFYAGITMTFGPVADVLSTEESSVIGDRAYATTPMRTAACARAAANAYRSAGVAPVVKHFPGHGGVGGDTHEATVVDDGTVEEIQNSYLPPFWAVLDGGTRFAMLSHVLYSGVDSAWPATLSPTVVSMLKQRPKGFSGVAMTDDLSMGAITQQNSAETAGVKALMAGNDMLMVGTLADARVLRDILVQALNSGYSGVVKNMQGMEVSVEWTAEEIRERVEDAVRRVLRAKFEAQLHEHEALAAQIANANEPDWAANAASVAEPVRCEITEGGAVIDDSYRCLRWDGNPAYWHQAATSAGIGGALTWTLATNAPVDNQVEWPLAFSQAGDFRLCVHRVAGFFESHQAPYTLLHSGETLVLAVDQRGPESWIEVGNYAFAAGADQFLKLVDSSGEALSLQRRLGVDAIAFVPEARDCAAGPL
jgi:beta-N-acetylhexosaminidase